MQQVFRFDLVLTTLAISFLFFWWKNKWEKRFVLIHQASVGLKYVKGIYVATLPPGRYRLNPVRDSITPVYMGVQYLNVGRARHFYPGSRSGKNQYSDCLSGD